MAALTQVEEEEEFVVIEKNLSMRIREHPTLSSSLKPLGIALLILGQCSTTVWAAYLAGARILILATLILALMMLAVRQYLAPPVRMQLGLAVLSMMLSFAQVINLYSAMSLYPLISKPDSSCSCLNAVYLPAFAVFAVVYASYCLWAFPLKYIVQLGVQFYGDAGASSTALAPAGCSWFTLFGHGGCVLATALCIVWALGHGLFRFFSTCGFSCSASLGNSHSVGLVLHSVALISAELFRHALVVWHRDVMLGCLLTGQWLVNHLGQQVVIHHPKKQGAFQKVKTWFNEELKRFQNGSPGRLESMLLMRKRSAQLWNLLHELIPPLRQAAPPKMVVAVLVALQHTAPVITVGLACLLQLQMSWVSLRLVVLGLSLLLAWETHWQLQLVPDPALQRILLLVPTDYLDPFSRTLIGYGLSVTKHVQTVTSFLDQTLFYFWSG